MKLTRDRLGALFFLAFSIAYGALAFQIKLFPGSEYEAFTARTLPVGLASAGILVSLLMIVLPEKPEGAAKPVDWRGLHWRKALLLCVLMFAYGATITELGFVVSTSLFLVLGIVLLGERRWYMVLGLAIPVALGFWFILTRLLGIYLEPGLFF